MKMMERRSITILLAEDDPDDRMLVQDAVAEGRLVNELRCVEDGEELMDYLHQRGQHSGAPRPGLILLDLNMPRKDEIGRASCRERV